MRPPTQSALPRAPRRRSSDLEKLELDEGLKLLRVFFKIGNREDRARILALAEQLAAEESRRTAASSD